MSFSKFSGSFNIFERPFSQFFYDKFSKNNYDVRVNSTCSLVMVYRVYLYEYFMLIRKLNSSLKWLIQIFLFQDVFVKIGNYYFFEQLYYIIYIDIWFVFKNIEFFYFSKIGFISIYKRVIQNNDICIQHI